MRFDSEYYQKEFLKNEFYLRSEKSISEFCENKIVNIKTLTLKKTFNYLEISNISLTSLQYETKNIDFDKIPDRATYILRNKDVVVSTVRPNRNAVALINKAKRIVGTSGFTVIRIDERKEINPYYLFVFCKTKFFITKLIRENTASMYPAVTDFDILKIKIPLFSNSFQTTIENRIKQAQNNLELSKQVYSQAETLLLEEVGLQNFKPSTEKINVKSFKDSFIATGRLDAEYYQVKYEDYLKLVKKYQNGFEPLNTACLLKDINFNPAEITEYKYIELSDIGKTGEISGCTTALGNELPSRARRKVKTGDVIISSIEGSLESCALVQKEYDNALCSTGFYVINSKKINSETLLVLFKSELMQNILKQGCSGTILTAINKNEFLNIPVPIIETDVQQKISELVEESFRLKKESENLLELAKRMVEVAIEEGEEKAIFYMKNALKI